MRGWSYPVSFIYLIVTFQENSRRIINPNISVMRSTHCFKAYFNEYRPLRKSRKQNVQDNPWRLKN